MSVDTNRQKSLLLFFELRGRLINAHKFTLVSEVRGQKNTLNFVFFFFFLVCSYCSLTLFG